LEDLGGRIILIWISNAGCTWLRTGTSADYSEQGYDLAGSVGCGIF
jgi:hypothetical protein